MNTDDLIFELKRNNNSLDDDFNIDDIVLDNSRQFSKNKKSFRI